LDETDLRIAPLAYSVAARFLRRPRATGEDEPRSVPDVKSPLLAAFHDFHGAVEGYRLLSRTDADDELSMGLLGLRSAILSTGRDHDSAEDDGEGVA
jgi:hypothetical protein